MREPHLRQTESGGRCTRRQLIQIGGISLLGLSLPELLWARSPVTASRSRIASEKSCIFIVQYGGASHIDTLDPEPNAPAEIHGPYRPIATAVPGIQFGELLP